MQIYQFIINSPIGNLKISYRGGVIVGLEPLPLLAKMAISGFTEPAQLEFERFLNQEILNYFLAKGSLAGIPFSLDALPNSTSFQVAVWKAMAKVPYGETITYSELATQIGSPTSQRAVANACGKNPILLLVPCHRVIAKNGLGGFRLGKDIKRRLLSLEGTI